MNARSDFFSMPRFLKCLRLTLAENYRLLLMLTIISFCALCVMIPLFCNAGLSYYEEDLSRLPFIVVEGGGEIMDEMVVMISLAFTYVGGAAGAFSLMRMSSKQGRQRFLLLPASRTEKYLASVVHILVIWLLFFVTFCIADFLRVVVYEAIYPSLAPYIYPLISNPEKYVRSQNIPISFLSFSLLAQSFLRLGTLFWRSHPYIKTAAALLLTVIIGALTGSLFLESVMPNGYYYPRYAAFTDERLWFSLFIGATLFNEWLVYLRLNETEITDKR